MERGSGCKHDNHETLEITTCVDDGSCTADSIGGYYRIGGDINNIGFDGDGRGS